ncbi:helix-turn-helix transcriptional regulator [Microbacterium sp. Leaf161]|uniref:helix-turn-helix transcriptional regulator n=1 Tax=Microbacterium sp. Leaf161 TaxID=1736281 RepID=UPI001F44BE1E|nr:helix-turn-helix transcriptional regulator [Microbacterium sp. Leaf161]
MPLPEPDLTRLRAVLNERRHAAGFTFEQLAEASGISRQTLLNISSGKYNGDLRTWLKLSRTFGVSIDELLGDVWR